MKKIIYLTLILAISSSCINRTQEQKKIITHELKEKESPKDSLIAKEMKQEFILDELEEYYTIQDTIKIISTSRFLYYPFGENESIEQFSSIMALYFDSKNKETYYEPGEPIDTTFLWKYQYKNSFIKAMDNSTYNEEAMWDKYIQLISGKICDNGPTLVNGVKVGMKKEELIDMYCRNLFNENELENMNVIELISGLTGIWHYYIFENDVLKCIIFDTDFMVNKL